MMKLLLVVATSLLIATGASSMSCSGGGGDGDGDYYSDLDEADQRFGERIDATGDIEDEDEKNKEGVDAYRDFIDDLAGMEAPDDAEPAHRQLVNAFAELDRLAQEIGTPSARTEAELDAAFPRLVQLGEDIARACQRLESVAGANGLSLELFCAEED